MPYKLNKNQEHLEKSFTRFNFYFKHKGIQNRKTVVCRKSAVETFYRDWQNEIFKADNPQQKHSLFEILDEYLKFSHEFKSIRSFKHEKTIVEDVIKKFYKHTMLLNDFTRAEADAFILWRKKHTIAKYENTKTRGQLANSTVNRNIALLSYFFNWAIKKGYYNRLNPFALQKLKENNYREVMLSPEQIEELFSVAQDIDDMLYKTISIFLLTGMRRGELFSLEWAEVNFNTRFIILSHNKTKGKKSRAIPISPALNYILLSLKNNQSGQGQLVMGGYTVNILVKQWKKLLKQVPFPVISNGTKLRVHDLRHVYSQSLLNLGVSLEDIQSLLGHQDFSTTQRRYAQFSRPDLLEKGSMIDNVIKIKRVL